METTAWTIIPIHVIVSFFGFFTITSVFSGFKDSFKINNENVRKIVMSNMIISILFWIVIIVHIIWGLLYLTPLCQIYDFTFISFSLAWGLAMYPIVLFWFEVCRIVQTWD